MNMQIVDPRATRTRQLITSAFDQLIATKNFDQITVKDITNLATINRATFYRHFLDKYELVDVMLSEKIEEIMKFHVNCLEELNENMIVKMFQSLSQIQKCLYKNRRLDYDTFAQMVEGKIKEKLAIIVNHTVKTANHLKATMFSWALYGAFVEWKIASKETIEEFAKRASISLLQIINFPN